MDQPGQSLCSRNAARTNDRIPKSRAVLVRRAHDGTDPPYYPRTHKQAWREHLYVRVEARTFETNRATLLREGTSELGGIISISAWLRNLFRQHLGLQIPPATGGTRTRSKSTSSVDKSVHKELLTSFLGCWMATEYLIAYFLGIELGRLWTTIYWG